MKVKVIEVPCISTISSQLKQELRDSKTVLFADVCKVGDTLSFMELSRVSQEVQAPLQHFITSLKAEGVIGRSKDWEFVSSVPTYNPLGSTVTFLSEADIMDACRKLSEGLSR